MLILDRDGVINHDSDAYIKSVAEWTPIAGSIEAMARLSQRGYRLAVASNQSGLARGLFTLTELNAMHQRLQELVSAQGGRIELIAFCPHGPRQGCTCRKPGTALLDDIGERLGSGLKGVPFIGDSLSDIQAARKVGAAPWLVRTGKGERTLTALRADSAQASAELDGVRVFRDLADAADTLLQSLG
ncbi:D-glycero-beta-D-manno-heptose-1,7-bisphosphate 7-phosphatase [Thiocystis violacea]|nr:D-glycero-beta-D-manno-heptose-1,7-bisphosphate 7-phosphatase [Thiocystis violacea]